MLPAMNSILNFKVMGIEEAAWAFLVFQLDNSIQNSDSIINRFD